MALVLTIKRGHSFLFEVDSRRMFQLRFIERVERRMTFRVDTDVDLHLSPAVGRKLGAGKSSLITVERDTEIKFSIPDYPSLGEGALLVSKNGSKAMIAFEIDRRLVVKRVSQAARKAV